MGTAPLRTPTFVLDARQSVDDVYEIRARIPAGGGVLRTSSNAVQVVLDDTPPTIEIRNPNSPNLSINNATGIALDAALRIASSEPFDRTPTVVTTPNIPGVLSKPSENVWLFTPQGNWQAQTSYTVRVTQVSDRAGNIAPAYQVNFQTAAAQGALIWSAENTLQPAGFSPNLFQLTSSGYVLYLAAQTAGGSANQLTAARLDGISNSTTILGTLGSVVGFSEEQAQVTGDRVVFAQRERNNSGAGLPYNQNLRIVTAQIDLNALTTTVLESSTQVFANFSSGQNGYAVATNPFGDLALATVDSTGLWLRTFIDGEWQAPVQIGTGQIAGSFKVSIDSSRIARVYWTRISSAVPATPYTVVLSQVNPRAASATHQDIWTNLSLTPQSMTLLTNDSGTNLMGFSYTRNSRNLISAAYQDSNGIGFMDFETWASGQASFSINPSGLAVVAYARRSSSFEVSSINLTSRSQSGGMPASFTVRDYVNAAPFVPDANRVRNVSVSLSNTGVATVGGMLRTQPSDMYQLQLPSGTVTALPNFTMNTSFGTMRTLDSGQVIFISSNRWRSLR
ncbi:MAG: Ig-like domain-containing protein [Brachymonas sp.]|nr:Ig-like domain-containing protein [Brachymonas sp.]